VPVRWLDLPGTLWFDGQVVRYGSAGEGPALILVHGTPFSSFVWRRIVPILSRHRTVFWYDLLGYGQSEMRDGQDVSLGVQNRVLTALIDHWGVERPDVVAHDFGGATALRTCILDKRDYRSLTLVDPVALSPWGSPFVQHVRKHEAAFCGLPASIHAALVSAYIQGAAFVPLSAETLAAYARPWIGETGQAAFYRQIAQMDQRFTDEIATGIPGIRTPTLILWGEKDDWIPIDRGRKLASLIPGASFRAVPDAGHLLQEDAPEAIVAALLEFLGST
jgi:pimeloyl-ACP methyl ester carboxylesterase